MNSKITKTIIFAVAIVDCILALAFAGAFNDEKKDSYSQVEKVKAANPALLDDLQAATPESLTGFLTKYQTELGGQMDAQKKARLQKDIFYTYLRDLKELDKESFDAYKAGFGARSKALFAKSDKKQEFTDGFAEVNEYKDLESYVSGLSDEYNALKQDFLTQEEYIKAANGLIARADQINATASANKKAAELEELQKDVKSFNTNAGLQNAMLIIGYILFIANLALLIFFALAKLVTNFKSSYKVLLILLLFGVIFLIGYLAGTPELTPSATRMGITPTGFKIVNACVFSLYVTLLVAVVAVIVTAVVGAVKKRA